MIVTDITEWNKKKYKVYVDYEFAFVLYKGELHKYKIQKEQMISEALYREIKENILLKRARLRAMNLLAKRPYTEVRLRQKLKDGLYPEKCIDGAIDYVKSFGYIDDAAYARDYIAYHMESQSKRQIEQKLMAKGICQQTIQNCIAELCEDNGQETEMRQIRSLFQKRYKGQLPTDSAEIVKMMNYFLRKGYSQSMVKRVLSEMDLDDLYKID